MTVESLGLQVSGVIARELAHINSVKTWSKDTTERGLVWLALSQSPLLDSNCRDLELLLVTVWEQRV